MRDRKKAAAQILVIFNIFNKSCEESAVVWQDLLGVLLKLVKGVKTHEDELLETLLPAY